MKRILAIAAAAAVLAPALAVAQERMSDAHFIAASRCISFAELPQLQSDSVDVSALRTAVARGFRSESVSSDARNEARRVRVTAPSIAAAEGGVDELRRRRDEACSSFVQTGLVQQGAAHAS